MGKKKEEVLIQDELVPQVASTKTPTEEVVKVVEEKTEPQVVTLAQKNKCRQ
jgi:ATP:corrinoid adenosyltransferase